MKSWWETLQRRWQPIPCEPTVQAQHPPPRRGQPAFWMLEHTRAHEVFLGERNAERDPASSTDFHFTENTGGTEEHTKCNPPEADRMWGDLQPSGWSP